MYSGDKHIILYRVDDNVMTHLVDIDTVGLQKHLGFFDLFCQLHVFFLLVLQGVHTVSKAVQCIAAKRNKRPPWDNWENLVMKDGRGRENTHPERKIDGGNHQRIHCCLVSFGHSGN